MPVQTTDLSDTLTFTANNQTWMIAAGVTVNSLADEGVLSTFDGSTLINRGVILADNHTGVSMTGNDAHVQNVAGAEIHGYRGVTLGTGGVIVNDGLINAFHFHAVEITSEGRLFNSGDISGNAAGVSASGAGSAKVYNSGTIDGGNWSILSTMAIGFELNNSGLLRGTVTLAVGPTVVNNSGTIFAGEVILSDVEDHLVNSGSIFGDVIMNNGANLFDGRRGAMNGYGVTGGADSDVFKGGADDDVFRTAAGLDTLNGKGGDDVLIGGGHSDRLSGGAGADTFVYEAKGDSTAALSDTITDFSAGQGDVIDLSEVDADKTVAGNQVFAFIGTAAFTDAGQLRYSVAGGHATLAADLDGDAIADFAIVLTDVGSLTGGDFVL